MRRVTPHKTVSALVRESKVKPESPVHKLRLNARLTVREVACNAGVSAPTVSRVESGLPPDIRTALRLARFYETTIEALWGELA